MDSITRVGKNGFVAFGSSPTSQLATGTGEDTNITPWEAGKAAFFASPGFVRGVGFAQSVGGGFAAIAGFGSCVVTLGGGCVAGAIGVDQLQAGLRTMWHGEFQHTAVRNLAFEASGNAAVADGVDLIAGLGAGAAADFGKVLKRGLMAGASRSAARSVALRHAGRFAGVELGATAVGGAYGAISSGGDLEATVRYAGYGSAIGGMAAPFIVKCFAAGTPVAVGSTVTDVAVGRSIVDDRSYQGVWLASGLAAVAASRLLKDERKGKRGLIPRGDSNEPVVPEVPPEPEPDFAELDFGSICEELQFS